MINKEKILELETRRQIYNYILKYPGLHLRELYRKCGISFGVLRYHLDCLEKREMIVTKKDSGFSRYYVTKKIGKNDLVLINVFRQKTLRKILIIFLVYESKGVFYKEDFQNLPFEEKWDEPTRNHHRILKHRTTLIFHLKKLIDLDLVDHVIVNGRSGYRLKHSVDLMDFLIKYQDELSIKTVNTLLRWTNRWIKPNHIDRFLDVFYEIFPNPYHV